MAVNRISFLFVRGILILALTIPTTIIAENILYIPAPEEKGDSRNEYFISLLHLVVKETTEEFGPLSISHSSLVANQGRVIHLLVKNTPGIHLLWTMTNLKRESLLLPIRIPLTKGLLSHRVCIIRKEDRDKFKGIKSIDEFNKKEYKIGSGHDWPDTNILRQGGFRVHTSSSYNSLFRMLRSQRFDCFARGVNEPWKEIVIHKDKDLIVDEHLAIVYRAPIYYFVNKNNKTLANRIEKGLLKIIRSGKFQSLFEKHHSELLRKAKLNKRNVIFLENPSLHPKTPVDNPIFWYKIK